MCLEGFQMTYQSGDAPRGFDYYFVLGIPPKQLLQYTFVYIYSNIKVFYTVL